MPFISTPEWVGIRKGLLEGIESSLDIKFGAEGLQFLPAIQEVDDLDALRSILRAIKTAAKPEDLRRFLTTPA